MDKGAKYPPSWCRRRLWEAGTIVLIVIATATLWWLPAASAGKPRLVVDRDVVDLGDLPFAAPARVVFTLTNAGNAALRITEDVRVKAVKGC